MDNTLPRRVTERVKHVARWYHPETIRERGWMWGAGLTVLTYAAVVLVLMLWWSGEPERFDVREVAAEMASAAGHEVVTGYTTTATVIRVAETLLSKAGGYLSNDIMPPGVFMDNMHNWEFGVLVQLRDMVRAMRDDYSRSQSQSVEDPDLAEASPLFYFDNASWIFPASEKEYEKGIARVRRYLDRLATPAQTGTQFYARADNLRDWLAVVEKRLGSLSQRLSASVGQVRINTDLAGDPDAAQATQGPQEVVVKTPWLEIDDVFYEARGAAWALIHFLQALEVDFQAVLEKKNALVSLRQIIRELEATQSTVWSPLVLNGGGFGIVTNYSLVMANYISRANAALIDLRSLLQQG